MSRTISSTYTSGITLTSTASNPVSVTGKISVASGNALTGIGGASDSWTIGNSGSILATSEIGRGINLGTFGTNVSNAVVTNRSGGLISASGAISYGIMVYGSGSVTNLSGGTISAGHIAVEFNSNTGTIVNYGVILASSNVAAYEREGGIITNLAGGTISGSTGVWFQYGAGTFTNAGTVIGTSSQDGAVLFNDQTSSNLLIVDPGAVFSGAVNGGLGELQLASASSAGSLNGFNSTSITNFGTLQFDAGAKWTVVGNTSASGLGTIAITGFTINDTIDLTNFAAVSETFASNALVLTNATSAHATLHIQGSFSSADFQLSSYGGTGTGITFGTSGLGHTLAGTYTATVPLASPANNPLTVLSTGTVVPTAVSGGYGALYGKGGASQAWTITNSGLLNDSTNGSGIQLGQGGTYVAASVITNQSGGTIIGAYGIRVYNTVASSVVNQAGGTIAATSNRGVYFDAASTLTNYGVILAPTLDSQQLGVLMENGGTIINYASGTISGYDGVVLIGTSTLVNAGTIEAKSTSAFAVELGSGAGSRLIVDPGAVFVGQVFGGYGTMELASAATAGTLTATSFERFDTVRFDAGSEWTLIGTAPSTVNTSTALNGTIQGFTTSETIDLLGFAAVSATYASGFLTLTNSATAHTTLHFSGGSLTTGNFQLGGNGTSSTYITFGTGPSPLVYGQTIDEAGIVATSETVTAGTLTLFNSGTTAVGTIAVGTSLSTGDFTLGSDGSGGTDVIVSTVFGTYVSGVTLLTNPATIAATAQVGNAAGGGNAVSGPAGTAWAVTNLGTITETGSAGFGVSLASGGTVMNAGEITGSLATAAVYLGGAGSVTNSGTMEGGSSVITDEEGLLTVTNTGVILSTKASSFAMILSGGGNVSNSSTGTIAAAGFGIAIDGAGGTITNSGTIWGTANRGIYLEAGTVVNSGLIASSLAQSMYISGAGDVTNLSTGTITGAFGLGFGGGQNDTLINAGTIEAASGNAVAFNGTGTHLLVVDPGAIFTGGILGGSGATAVMELASAASAGSIAGFGTTITNFTSLQFDPNARWTVSGNDLASGFGTLGISGFTVGDTIDLTGFVAVSDTFGDNAVTFTNAGSEQATLSLQGSFSSAYLHFGTDGATGTNIYMTAPTPLVYGQTIDEAGIVATSETVTAGMLTLFNSGTTAVGTIVVGTTLSTSDFTLNPDGTGGTDVIVSTVFGTYTSRVTLATNPTTIASTASVTYSGINSSVVAGPFGTAWTVTNLGTVNETGGSGFGISLAAGGTVVNSGLVASSLATAAVYLGGAGSVSNSGTMEGGFRVIEAYGGFVTVTNTGVILTTKVSSLAVVLNGGGSVTNSATGTISGAGYGMDISGAGGTISNSGTILGTSGRAIYLAAGTLLNSGLIATSLASAVSISGTADVTNLSTGTIGGASGVLFAGGQSDTVINAGTIEASDGDAVAFEGTGTHLLVVDPGAVFTGGIFGGSGASATMELASATGTGSIAGFGSTITNFTSLAFDPNARWTVSGNDLASGLGTLGISGFAVGDTIDLTGFVAVSDSFGDNEVTFTNASSQQATLSLQGSFSSAYLYFGTDGATGTNIYMTAPPPIVYGQTIDEAGIAATSETVTAGTLTLFNSGTTAVGTITVGTSLSTGDFTLNPDGSGGTDLIVSTVFGTYTRGVTLVTNPTTIASTASITYSTTGGSAIAGPSGTAWAVTNLGTIDKTGITGFGISLASGGTVVNAGQITGNLATAAVYLGGAGSVSNSGTMEGGSRVIAAYGGLATVTNTGVILTTISGFAIILSGGGSVTNSATGTISDAAYGIGIDGTGGTVSNSGTILGTAGRAIYLTAGTLLNSGLIATSLATAVYIGGTADVTNLSTGTISGATGVIFATGQGDTLINAGAIEASDGDAVAFDGAGPNLLVVDPGAVFTGGIFGGGGTSTVMELASAASAGSIAGFGATITNFRTLQFDEGARWTVSGVTRLQGNGSIDIPNVITGDVLVGGLGSIAITGFAVGDTIDLTNFIAVSDSFGDNEVTFTNAGSQQTTLHLQGSLSAVNLEFSSDGATGTDVYMTPPLVYGQTIDEAGIVATSETVTAGMLTLFNSGTTAVGTIAVGTSLSASDFTLNPDGSGGTDVIVSTVFGTYVSGVTLLTNPTTIASTASVSSAATSSSAVFGSSGTVWSVINLGAVDEIGAGGFGISLASGGTVVNSGLISSSGSAAVAVAGPGSVTNLSAGRITNAGTGEVGVAVALATGNVTNYGTITAGTVGIYAGTATVTNTGLILSSSTHGAGVFLAAGGYVTNGFGGDIGGSDGIFIHNGAGTINNSGTIQGTGGDAVYLDAGTLVNSGLIQGSGGAAVYLGTGTLLNSGLIQGNGDAWGVSAYATDVTNLSSGTISGSSGVMFFGDANQTLVNAGTIIGGDGTAVSFASGTNLLVDDPGAVFTGAIFGGFDGTSEMELASASSAGTVAGFGTTITNFTSLQFDEGAHWTVSGNDLANGLGTLSIGGFASGDTIDLTGFAAVSRTAASNALVLTDGSRDVATLAIQGTFTTSQFTIASDGDGGTDITLATDIIPCFRAGTRILTPRGEVRVEDLRVGDLVATVSGQTQPIAWIGRRSLDCRRHPSPERIRPIRVSPHAFGENRPKRALHLSPDHSVFVEDVLIPVKFLVNGTTIVQIDAASVTYYHLELPRHDVVLAEGMPAETYLETGGRSSFENGGGAMRLHPDFAPDEAQVAILWETRGYAPLLGTDGQFDRVRARLALQASMLGYLAEGTPPGRARKRAGG